MQRADCSELQPGADVLDFGLLDFGLLTCLSIDVFCGG
jgi:hypothetical protein